VILYSRACGSFYDFFDRGLLLTKQLLKQGFLVVKWKSSLGKIMAYTSNTGPTKAEDGPEE
jgi:hypothetical protein